MVSARGWGELVRQGQHQKGAVQYMVRHCLCLRKSGIMQGPEKAFSPHMVTVVGITAVASCHHLKAENPVSGLVGPCRACPSCHCHGSYSQYPPLSKHRSPALALMSLLTRLMVGLDDRLSREPSILLGVIEFNPIVRLEIA
jgi:hypothetical protein